MVSSLSIQNLVRNTEKPLLAKIEKMEKCLSWYANVYDAYVEMDNFQEYGTPLTGGSKARKCLAEIDND